MIKSLRHRRWKKVVQKSGLFDVKYYLFTYPDVRKKDIDPVKHYIKFGAKEGRNPSKDFDTKYYLENNPDVKESGINPLAHYLLYGQYEARNAGKPLRKYAKINNKNTSVSKIKIFSKVTRTIRNEPQLVYKSIYSIYKDGLFITIEKMKLKLTNGYYEPTLLALNNLNISKHSQELDGMTYNPFVSIIVPNYNHAKFLNKRIDSILEQTYNNYELILLDDCSTDNSKQILQEYANNYPNKIRTMFNTENAGNVFKQWYKGIESAKGELIWICESDDFCENDFLEKIVQYFKNPAVNIAFGKIQFCDLNDKVVKGLDNYREGAEGGIWDKSLVRPANLWFCNAFGVNNVIANVGGCVFKKQNLSFDIWQEAQTYKILGDWFLYSHIANGGLIAYEPSAIAYFRQHGLNTSVSSFTTSKYYEEHFSLMKNLKNMWEIPTSTVDKFYSKIEFQYKHFKCDEKLGQLSNYVNIEELKNTQRRKKHILVAILAFHPGGGELFPINLANALQNEENVVVSLFVFNMQDINKDMYSLVDKRIAIFDSKFVTAYGVGRFIEDAGVSLINSHMVSLDVFFLVRHKVKIPYFPTLHGSYEACNVQQNVIKDISEGVTHWIYTADRNLSVLEFLNIPKIKMTKLSNAMAIDAEPFPQSRKGLGIKDDTAVFTLVARGIKRKGWRASIEAFLLLEKKFPNVHLLLCGDGDVTKDHQINYRNNPKITFLGYQSKIHGLYKISDCAIVPTRFAGESYPLCIIQAMQVGVPVIATDIGEIKNMIISKDKKAGIIIKNERDTNLFISSLEQAMGKVLDKELRIIYAKDAKKLGENYNISKISQKYIEIYEKAIDWKEK